MEKEQNIKLTPKEEKAKRRLERKQHGFFAEFKKFIMRGNVVDMATGVIVAASFKDIITSLTNDIFMPWVNYLMFSITGGKKGELITILNNEPYFIMKGEGEAATQIVNPACIFINWGKFINAIINFLLVALIIFLTIKIIQSVRKRLAKVREKINEDELAAEKAYMAKVEAKEKAEAAKKAAEKAEADKAKAEEKSTNELLVEVINLLNK